MENLESFSHIEEETLAHRIDEIAKSEFKDISEFANLEARLAKINSMITNLNREIEQLGQTLGALDSNQYIEINQTMDRLIALQGEVIDLQNDRYEIDRKQMDIWNKSLQIERDRISDFINRIKEIEKQFNPPKYPELN